MKQRQRKGHEKSTTLLLWALKPVLVWIGPAFVLLMSCFCSVNERVTK